MREFYIYYVYILFLCIWIKPFPTSMFTNGLKQILFTHFTAFTRMDSNFSNYKASRPLDLQMAIKAQYAARCSLSLVVNTRGVVVLCCNVSIVYICFWNCKHGIKWHFIYYIQTKMINCRGQFTWHGSVANTTIKLNQRQQEQPTHFWFFFDIVHTPMAMPAACAGPIFIINKACVSKHGERGRYAQKLA